MLGRISFALLTICACTLTSTARADIDVFINFDRDTNGIALESPAVINEVYLSWGVTFGSNPGAQCGSGEVYATSACLSEPAPTSAPNIVSFCAGCSDISEDTGYVIATFLMPADSVCITAIAAEPNGRSYLRAYDAEHNLVVEDISNPELASDVLCVTGPAIHTVEFTGLPGEFAWFDDMQVSFAEVPVEPVTWSGIKARER
ncbi:MAG TPA: hypothetical protein VF720_08540 [Candidatus Eisenbacteria bacterium]